jgi:micrococcal nuclease
MYTYYCTINNVVDGDTVNVDIDLGFNMWVKKESVRLFGIDAPESRTKDLVEKKFGLYTKEVVEKFLPVGTRQELVTVKPQAGKYGRILGEFVVDDPDVPGHKFNLNRWLVDNNLAVWYDGSFSRDKLKDFHHENRKILIKEGKVLL